MLENTFKLAVFDIDGTLTIKNDEIPLLTIEAIKTLKEIGVHCLIATGRPKKALENIMKITGINNFISLNGQYVSYKNEIIYKYDYPQEVIDKVIEISNQHGCHCVLTNEKGYYTPALEDILQARKSSVLIPANMRKTHEAEDVVNQIEVYCDENPYHIFTELLDKYYFTRWHSGGFDIVINGRSKTAGIKEIAEKLHIKKDEIICFGDGENDRDMVEYVGMGVAMGNAVDCVKEVANYITDNVDQDGIYKACKELGLF